MTWIKRLAFLASLFLGLYFFGDFRINDVHVRDTLQTWIPPETMMLWKDKAVKTVESTLKEHSLNSDDKIQQKSEKLDDIPEKDQKKFKNLMEDLTKK